jgi:hypothetical protein
LDSFGKPETFSRVFKKLLESYALDAIDQFNPQRESKVHKSQVTDLIKSAQSARIESRPSVGLGTDLRLETRKLTGFALDLNGHLLQCSIFTRLSSENMIASISRMVRFSSRSRLRE